MLFNIRRTISNNLHNIHGWSTNRKIVVIESDDWGSIRMPSKNVYEKLLKNGIRVDKCPYNKYDSLASEDDLTALFNVLRQFLDKNERTPVITANVIIANPDFEKIRESGFKTYQYELFTETLKKYPGHVNSFSIWKQGMKEGVFFPQFHGREHLNVNRWMKGLQDNLSETHLAFNNELFGISTDITTEKRRSYLAAFDFDTISEIESQKKIINDGLEQFEKLFGYRSFSYIATNYVWHKNLETKLATDGIKYIQGSFIQREPKGDNSSFNLIKHYLGESNSTGQHYLIRNCNFEPSLFPNNNSVENCLQEIKTAFRWRKPAIISSHRLNYIGSIVPENRDINLKLLLILFRQILVKWPQVEFKTSVELGELIAADNL